MLKFQFYIILKCHGNLGFINYLKLQKPVLAWELYKNRWWVAWLPVYSLTCCLWLFWGATTAELSLCSTAEGVFVRKTIRPTTTKLSTIWPFKQSLPVPVWIVIYSFQKAVNIWMTCSIKYNIRHIFFSKCKKHPNRILFMNSDKMFWAVTKCQKQFQTLKTSQCSHINGCISVLMEFTFLDDSHLTT